jgi:hypothetical protein
LKIIIVLIILHAVFSAAGFGLAYSFTRGTAAARMVPVVAAALWPALLVASQSLLGYRSAGHFSWWLALALLVAGLFWSGLVAIIHRSELRQIEWTTNFAIFGLSVLAGLLVVVPHIWNNDFGCSEFSNGEFLNYAQLASFSLGYQQSPGPVPWEMFHESTRDGIDFINATISILTRQQPANVVQLAAALLRMAYFSALLLAIRGILATEPKPLWGVGAIGIMFAFWNFDRFQFEVSFMAASLSLSIVLSALLLVSTKTLRRPQAVLLYVILNIALLVSYPETMIMLKCIEVVFVASRWKIRFYLANAEH